MVIIDIHLNWNKWVEFTKSIRVTRQSELLDYLLENYSAEYDFINHQLLFKSEEERTLFILAWL